MMRFVMTASGHQRDDIIYALEETLRLVKAGYIESWDVNATGQFKFECSGDPEKYHFIVQYWHNGSTLEHRCLALNETEAEELTKECYPGAEIERVERLQIVAIQEIP